jgi:hypothetical protein
MVYVDSHNGVMARISDQATRTWDGLQLLADRIPTLKDLQGEFVGEISSLLCICSEVYQDVSNIDLVLYIRERWAGLDEIYFKANYCLKAFSARGSRFSLYTPAVGMNHVTVIYPRDWDEGEYASYMMKRSANILHGQLCKVLRTTNIVLYISKDEPSRYPPWKSDEYRKKRLMDSSILSFSRSQYGDLNQDFLSVYPLVSQDVPDIFGKGRAAASDQDQPYKNIQTPETQEIPVPTSFLGAEAMSTGRTDWDKLFPSTQDRQSSPRYQPLIIGTKGSPLRTSQSRPSPMIQKLVPSEGTAAGGTEVTLLGSGFYQGLEIMFGDVEATLTTFWGENCLNCIVPPASQSGSVKVRFKHELHQIFLTTCVYKYIGDYEVEMQIPRVVPESTSQQRLTSELGAAISRSSGSKMSPIMLTNLAIMKYLAECLATLDVLSSRNNDIQEEVGCAVLSLRYALEKGTLDDDTILSAILLWSIEKIRNDQHTAERHWEGIKVLTKLRPDFDIGLPLGRICFLALLILTNQERNSLSEASEVLRAAFRSAMESGVETDIDNQSVAITSAPTPAATVYSPWSEIDAEPPPYMLSPTPLKQACLIYAAVNTHR